MAKRRNHAPAFKAKVALAALSGNKTIAELSTEYGIHQTQINRWVKQLKDGAAGVFSGECLTEERRKQLVKQVKGLGEDAKVVIRNARRNAIEEFKKLKKDGVSEDEIKKLEEEIQKLTDENSKKIDAIFAAKEKDIMTV